MHTPFVALCAACGNPVDDGDGVLHVDTADATSVVEALDMARGLCTVDPLTMIELAHWRVHHAPCIGFGSHEYVLRIDEVRTFPRLVRATAHLITTKPWLAGTDWASLLERLADTGTIGAVVAAGGVRGA